DEPDLQGFVAVVLDRLHLRHHARACLQHGCRMDTAVGIEQLRHPDFLADESVDHGYFPCSFPKALISTSTPAGRSSFINASTVCGVGSKMSISRSWVRRSQDRPLVLRGREWNRARQPRAGPLRGVDDLARRLVENPRVVRFEADA